MVGRPFLFDGSAAEEDGRRGHELVADGDRRRERIGSGDDDRRQGRRRLGRNDVVDADVDGVVAVAAIGREGGEAQAIRAVGHSG